MVNDTAPEAFIIVQNLCFVGAAVAFQMITDSLSMESPPDSLSIEISPDTLSIATGVGVTLCFIVQWIYMVVTIEQTIQRNPVIRNGPRFPSTFGQVCAFPVDYYVD